MKLLNIAALAALISLTGCAGLDDAMTPSMKVMRNDFDNSTILRQPPILASRPAFNSDDAPHSLGFEWNTGEPDIVYVTAGVPGQILNIYELAFIADDVAINGIQLASGNTEYNTAINNSVTSRESLRRFAMPLSEFKKITTARIVKMKVVRDTDFSLSRFGQEYPDVTVSRKIVAFLSKVDEYRSVKK